MSELSLGPVLLPEEEPQELSLGPVIPQGQESTLTSALSSPLPATPPPASELSLGPVVGAGDSVIGAASPGTLPPLEVSEPLALGGVMLPDGSMVDVPEGQVVPDIVPMVEDLDEVDYLDKILDPINRFGQELWNSVGATTNALGQRVVRDSFHEEGVSRDYTNTDAVYFLLGIAKGVEGESLRQSHLLDLQQDREHHNKIREELRGPEPDWKDDTLIAAADTLGISLTAAAATTLTKNPAGALSIMLPIVNAETYIDSIERGVPHQQAEERALWDMIYEGAGEMLSMSPFLRLIDLEPGSAALKEVGSFLIRELPAELATTFAQKMNERAIVEPNKPVVEFMNELGYELLITGLVTPFVGGAQASVTQLPYLSRKATEKGVELIMGKKDGTYSPLPKDYLDVLNEIEGPREDLQTVVETEETGIDQLEQEILRTAEEKAAEAGTPTGLAGASAVDPMTTPWEAGTEAGYKTSISLELNNKFIDDYGRHTDLDNLPQDAIIPDGTSRMQTDIEVTQEEIARMDRVINQVKFGGQAHPEFMLEQAIAHRKDLEIRLQEQQQEQKLDQRFAQDAAAVIQRFNEKLGIHTPYLVTTRDFANKPHTLGYAGRTSQGVNAIYLKTAARHGDGLTPEMRRAGALETVLHEYGHTVIRDMYANLPERVQAALQVHYLAERKLAGDLDIAKGILRTGMPAWDTFEGPRIESSYVGHMKREFVPSPPMQTENALGALNSVGTEYGQTLRKYIAYRLEFAEWLANQFVKHSETSSQFSSEVRQFFQNSVEAIDTIRKSNSAEEANPTITYERFVNRLMKVEELQHKKDELMALEERARSAWKANMGTPTSEVINVRVGGLIEGLFGPSGKRMRDRFQSDMDKFGWYVNQVWGLEHVSEANKHVPGVTRFLNAARQMWADKSKWTVRPQDDAKRIYKLVRRKKRPDWEAAMIEADRLSDEKQGRLSRDEISQLALDFGLNDQEVQAMEVMWTTYRDAITDIEEILVRDKIWQEKDLVQREKDLQKIRKTMSLLRNRNYLPHTRFGKYGLLLRAPHDNFEFREKTYQSGEQVFFETWESEFAQNRRLKELEKRYGADFIDATVLTDDTVRMLQGLPGPLQQMLKERLALTEVQREELDMLALEISPGEGFKKKLLKRKGVEGYSLDVMRAFNDYFVRFSNHYARLKNVPDLEDALTIMDMSAKPKGGVFKERDGQVTVVRKAEGAPFKPLVKRGKIVNWYKDTFEYLINPGNELSAIRALAFHYYLAFLPKAALLNMTQVPFVAGPYLGQRFGDLAAARMLPKVMKDYSLHFRKGFEYDPLENEMVRRGRLEGWLEESAATEMAAAADGLFVDKFAGGSVMGSESLGKMFRGLNAGGTWMFHKAEQWNREIVARAAYRLAKEGNKFSSERDYFQVARDAVKDTQFEYARFNRPRMMRGKKAAIFVFMQYVTNMLFFIGNDPAKWRYLGVLLLTAGLSGLPGAENIMDLYDAFMTKFKSKFGMKDPKTQVERDLRALIQEIADNGMPWIEPDSVIHGATRNIGFGGLGPWDMSGSLSFGRPLPLTDVIAREGRSPSSSLGSGLASLGGAPAEMALNIWEATFSDNPDTWRRLERAMPNYLAAVSQAVRLSVRGKETTLSGYPIQEFNVDSWKDYVTMSGRAAGFPLTELNQTREQLFAKDDAVRYYQGRRNIILSRYWHEMNHGDWDSIEGPGGVLEQVKEYNKIVPFEEMGISGKDLQQSIRARKKASLKSEAGMEQQRKYGRYGKEILDDYGFESIHTKRLGFPDQN